MDNCKTCRHWKNEQSELGYDTFNGICTCYKWRYNSNGDGDVMIYDRENKHPTHTNKSHRLENQNHQIPVGSPERSRYCLVTDEKFGCVHHESKDKKEKK
jgi:hypothetical protein